MNFFLVKDAVFNKQLNSFFRYQLFQRLGSVRDVQQAALLGFLDPLVGVVVAVEHNAIMFLGGFLKQFLQVG